MDGLFSLTVGGALACLRERYPCRSLSFGHTSNRSMNSSAQFALCLSLQGGTTPPIPQMMLPTFTALFPRPPNLSSSHVYAEACFCDESTSCQVGNINQHRQTPSKVKEKTNSILARSPETALGFWHMLLTPALERQREADLHEASLGRRGHLKS